jgi:hypothetical protein
MGNKMIIPEDKQQDLLDVLWPILVHVESRVKQEDILIRRDVEFAFKLLNQLKITTARPRWFDEEKWNKYINNQND